MPPGAIFVMIVAIIVSAGLSLWTFRYIARNSWGKTLTALTFLGGASILYFLTLYLCVLIFDQMYPFVPTEIPEGTGAVFGFLIALGDAGASLDTLEWAIYSSYATAFTWVGVAAFVVWRSNWFSIRR